MDVDTRNGISPERDMHEVEYTWNGTHRLGQTHRMEYWKRVVVVCTSYGC